MREYSVPATTVVGDTENLVDAVYDNADRYPDAVVYRRRGAEGGWSDVTAAQFAAEVTAVGRGLVAAGVAGGDRVGVLSRTRYEWTLVDYAVLAVGGVTVPIYETSSADQVAWILSDAEAVAVVVESAKHRELVDEVSGSLPALRRVWQIEAPTGKSDGRGAVDELGALGADTDAEEVHARRRAIRADDLATLIYTSGTTGRPKGCELTHRGLLSDIKSAADILPELLSAGGSVLLFLPLAHVFGKVIQCGALHTRTVVGHTPDVKNLVADLQEFAPTFLLAVPRVFEKVYNGARQRAHDEGKGRIFDLAAETAIAWSEARDAGGGPGLLLRLRHGLFDRLVYRKLRAVVGGKVRGRGVGQRAPGCPARPLLPRRGAADLRGVRADRDVRGGHRQHPRRPADRDRRATGARLRRPDRRRRRDPALRPDAVPRLLEEPDGDRGGGAGRVVPQRRRRRARRRRLPTITGRKKEIIVTAGGKNVAPAVLEDRLRAHPLVSQCLVVGDQKPFIAALVTIDPEALPGWRERNGKPTGDGVADLVDDPDLRAEIAAAVEEANKAVSRAEQIREFRILPVDFTEAGGELTPTMKVKRAVVATRFADDIEAIYSGVRQTA